jgi:hypothetical protein
VQRRRTRRPKTRLRSISVFWCARQGERKVLAPKKHAVCQEMSFDV